MRMRAWSMVVSVVALSLGGVPGVAQPAGDVVLGDIGARLDQYLSRLVPYGYSGAVLVAKDGTVLLKKAYGLADREANRPYTTDMVSCIGSVTKQFTAAAILKLEMEGRLSVSDPIAKYLPGVPPDKSSITIHQLLTHTAGLSGDFGGRDDDPIDRDTLVAKVLAAPLASKPGERFEYSNEGYSLAAAIVERVAGTGYETYLRGHVLLPAGLKDTGYLAPGWPLSRLPVGYTADGKPWGRVYKNGWRADGPGWYLRGNGGIHSSLDDLYRWHLALEAGTVLSADEVKKFQAGHVTSAHGERYGYGWSVQTTRRGTTVIEHNGGNGYFFTDFRRYVDEKVVIIAMTNEPSIPATQLAPRELEALVFGDVPVAMPPVGVPVAGSQRDALAGQYSLAGGGRVTVRATAAGLEAESDDPALFGALGAITPPEGPLIERETRSLALLGEASKGNFRPLFEAFNDERRFDVVQANQTRLWDGWRNQFGEFQRFEPLGIGIVQGDPAVTVRARFEKGGPVLQLIWGPRRLLGFRILTPAAVPLVPESPSVWVFYTYRGATFVRLTFGEAGQLRLDTAKGPLDAQRQ
jgi:CubicO group peptidase (beta-lactamase class C family)